jgi:diketogulonate reductase-like aldo/keto reductase
MPDVPTVILHDEVPIPQLGFGVWQIPAGDTERIVSEALEAGYRHIDTAAAYGNEAGVGAAIRSSGIPREEIFVTTKLWNGDQGDEEAREAFAVSLERLGLDCVDLYLIHWPMPGAEQIVETWRAFEDFLDDGRARAIGVSNFRVDDLEILAEETDVRPAINQIELHPRFQQALLRRYHAGHGITTEAWSPLAQGGLLDDPVLEEIAASHGKSTAQVILRWHLQIGNVVIPKSVTPERIRENIDLFDFELDAVEMTEIADLDRGRRIGADPDTFDLR